MKQNFTVRQGALDGVEAFLSVAQHRSFRRAAAELGVTPLAKGLLKRLRIAPYIRKLQRRASFELDIWKSVSSRILWRCSCCDHVCCGTENARNGLRRD